MRFNIADIDKERYLSVPVALFTQENYAILDNTARLVYGFLKGRMNLSRINNWVDENGDIFFVAKIAELSRFFGSSTSNMSKKLTLLEKAGLLERKKMGGNRADRLYLCQIQSDDIKPADNISEPFDSSIQSVPDYQDQSDSEDENVMFPEGNTKKDNDDSSFPGETRIFPGGNTDIVEFPGGNSDVSQEKHAISINNNINNNKSINNNNNNNSEVAVVADSLKKIGLSQHTINLLLAQYASDKIQKAINIFKAQSSRVHNPAGFLCAALKQDYQVPVSYHNVFSSDENGSIDSAPIDDNSSEQITYHGVAYKIVPHQPPHHIDLKAESSEDKSNAQGSDAATSTKLDMKQWIENVYARSGRVNKYFVSWLKEHNCMLHEGKVVVRY